jgi:murein hydrolase activator
MIRFTLTSLLLAGIAVASTGGDAPSAARAKELRDYIQREKPAFRERETQKHDLLESLDRINADQNRIRERLDNITTTQQEMSMSLDNLTLEDERQKKLENYERQHLVLLFKIVYRVKRDGLLRFLVYGENAGNLAHRLRVLYRTLRSQSLLTRQLQTRAARIAESEQRVKTMQARMQTLLGELNGQQDLLKDFLSRKRQLLAGLDQKQNTYQSAVKEYKQVARELSALFNNFESQRDGGDRFMPLRKTLPLPLEKGRVVRTFGRFVNKRFGTITYEKGIEIEAEHNSPVYSVLAGDVEFGGWVKGLGNVVIVHHGGGFYSLSAHLFKISKAKGVHVKQGEVVGFVGDTGNSDHPSLYFELRENNRALDPMLFFSQSALDQLTDDGESPLS